MVWATSETSTTDSTIIGITIFKGALYIMIMACHKNYLIKDIFWAMKSEQLQEIGSSIAIQIMMSDIFSIGTKNRQTGFK